MGKAKSTAKGRKIGRNKVYCARYSAENRREKNKKIKLKKHLKNQPLDSQAEKSLKNYLTK